MPKLIVTTRKSGEKTVEAQAGVSLMEALRDRGVDEVQAICGGCCACATCHVYVDAAWLDQLAPMSAEENDLLDGSMHRQPNSRLSCQISVHDSPTELRLTVAPEE